MSDVTHVLIHTFAKPILAQVCIEVIDMFDVAHVFINTFANIIYEMVSIE